MKKFLAVVVFCLPAFGQAAYSGPTLYQAWQSASVVTGGPLTYSARTDTCETGLESGCSGLGLSFLGCNTWSNGTYTSNNSTTGTNPCPVASGGTAPNIGGLTGIGNIIAEPGFNSQVVRLTGYELVSGSGPCHGFTSFNDGSSGAYNVWAADKSKVIIQPDAGVPCVVAFNPTTMASTISSIGGPGNSTCTVDCTTFDISAAFIFSITNPNLMWEMVPSTGVLNQLVISACSPSISTCTTNVAPTFANAANWVFSRTQVINFLSPPGCSGCAPLPSDFVPNYTGTFAADIYDTSITIDLSDNGQDYPTFGAGPAITAISESSNIVSVTNSSMTGWLPVVGSPVIIANVTPSGYNSGSTPWTVCGTSTGCTANPTATSFQYINTTTGLGAGTAFGKASYPSKTCPTPSGADPMNFSGHYGPIFALNYTAGAGPGGVAGWRVFDTCDGWITGNWGDSSASIWPNKAAPTDGTCSTGCAPDGQQPIGTSGGNSLPDRCYLHEGQSLPNPLYGKMGCAVGEAASNPGSCSGAPCSDNGQEWEVKTTNVRICLLTPCEGHTDEGYLSGITSPQEAVHTWHDPAIPNTNLISFSIAPGWDRHGSYNNVGPLDYQPVFTVPQQVCDNKGTPGSAATGTVGVPNGPCPSYFANFGTNEIIATENSIENPTGKHCSGAACVYRFGNAYNTGTSWNFNIANTTPSIDPTGSFVLFASDWNLTLGCTNGWDGISSGQLCLDPVSAGNSTSGTISQVSVDNSNNTTITATNPTTFLVGMYVKITGTAESWLNNQFLFVTSTTGATFSGTGVSHAAFSNTSDTGTASWAGCVSVSLSNAACPRSDVFVMALLSAH